MKSFNLIWLFVFFMSLFSFSLVAQPFEFPSGLVIQDTEIKAWELGENFTYNYFVFDTQTGENLNYSDVTCNFLLMNELGNEPILIDDYPCGLDTSNHKVNLSTDIINESGIYQYNVRCYTSTKGASLIGTFTINDYTQSDLKIWSCNIEQNQVLLYIIIALIIGLLIMTYLLKSPIIGIFAGIITIFLYLYIGACAPLILAPILIVGLLMTVYYAII